MAKKRNAAIVTSPKSFFIPTQGSKSYKAGVGAVYELPVPSGHVYLHGVQEAKRHKGFIVLRILDNKRKKIDDVAELIDASEMFVFMNSLSNLVRGVKGISLVGRLPIANKWRTHTAFLLRSMSGDRSNEPQWLIESAGHRDALIQKSLSTLTPAERSLPLSEIWSLLELIKRVETDWCIERELCRFPEQQLPKERAFEKKYGHLSFEEIVKLIDTEWGRKAPSRDPFHTKKQRG